ncbi:hypothetical protein GCM10027066_26330 [Dyella jejuensis]
MLSKSIQQLLSTYPRMRPELPAAHRAIYEEEYRSNREGVRAVEGLAKRMEEWMHFEVGGAPGDVLLELGAGTLNHVRFEVGALQYDAVEPFTALYEDSAARKHVEYVYASQAEIPKNHRYSRIVSIAVLEHMVDLPLELAYSVLHLDEDGVFKAGIPSEGGFLWWLGWRATTGAAYYLRHRLDYGVLMRHEHVNTAEQIIQLVRYFFADVKVRRFPFPVHHLSLYASIEARGGDADKARSILLDRGLSLV